MVQENSTFIDKQLHNMLKVVTATNECIMQVLAATLLKYFFSSMNN